MYTPNVNGPSKRGTGGVGRDVKVGNGRWGGEVVPTNARMRRKTWRTSAVAPRLAGFCNLSRAADG